MMGRINERNMVMRKLGALLFLLFASASHADERLQTVQVAGLSVPGTPTIAKELGFTQCEDKYSYYECKRNKPTIILGAKADSASVFFDGADNFSRITDSRNGPKISTVPPEKLSYRSIRLELHLTERAKLESALLADGWMKSGYGNSRNFYKEGVAATFSTHRSLMTLEPIALSEVQVQIDALKTKAAEEAKAGASAGAFIDSMKK